MSDILVHAAIIENQKWIKSYVQKTINPYAVIDASYYQCNVHTGEPLLGNANAWTLANISQCPQMVKDWKTYLTPLVKTLTNGFKVCDTSGTFRCGASCSWTVPAGVTSVQFQLWGVGSGSGSNCCCGGAPFGITGGYMLSTVPVSAGQVFTLCAGCSYCCYASQTTPGIQGTATYITNNTSTYSVCVESPLTCFANWNAAVNPNNWNTIALPTIDGCSATQCSGWNFCWDTAADNTIVPHAFGLETWKVLTNTINAVNYGLPIIYPAIYVGNDASSGQIYSISGPVFGFENCTCCLNNNAAIANGTGGCYYSAQNGYQQIPAVGGYAGFVCGGYDACGGDAGGMGMICVSYN
jgi:hypothetical protein